MRHVLERGVETQVLRLQLCFPLAQGDGALLHELVEPAVELLEFLDHQRDRAIGAVTVVVRLLVGFGDNRQQRLEVQFAGARGRLCKLSGEELMHRRVPVSPLSW